MKPIVKNEDGTYTLELYLKEGEHRILDRLSRKLGKNIYETLKYSLQLVSWWSRNRIEPADPDDDEEDHG